MRNEWRIYSGWGVEEGIKTANQNTFKMWLKVWFWFFRGIDIEVYLKGVIETLFW